MTAHLDTFVRDSLPPRDQWPEMTFTLPELQFPAQYNASEMLDAAVANGHGARPAVLPPPRRARNARRMAGRLPALGGHDFQPGRMALGSCA